MTDKQQKLNKSFNITSVCRQDLISSGLTQKQALEVDDYTMQNIASKMADAFCETDSYWLALDEALRIYELQK